MRRRYGEDESECVLSIHVEPVETLLADETEGFVERKGCRVVVFGFKDDLKEGMSRSVLV